VKVSTYVDRKCALRVLTLALPMLVRSTEVGDGQPLLPKDLLLASDLPKKETRYKKVNQGMIMKSSRRTSFLSCFSHQPLFGPDRISCRATYDERPLLLTLPFIRIREPIKRGHLLSMLSITIVDSLLVRN
jgi:hypothetical protein